jgi:hypothetical protein
LIIVVVADKLGESPAVFVEGKRDFSTMTFRNDTSGLWTEEEMLATQFSRTKKLSPALRPVESHGRRSWMKLLIELSDRVASFPRKKI